MGRELLTHRSWLFASILAAGCAPTPKEKLAPGDPKVLSPANGAAAPHDEDASILLASDDRFYVAWLSNRDGNDDLYVMRSDDGLTWSAPSRVTTSLASDWYPTLVQGSSGLFHLVWMRQEAATRTVWYNSSPDGITWSPAAEVQVTKGTSDDFVPYAVEHAGKLLVYFDSLVRSGDATRSILLVQSTALAPSGAVTGWSAPLVLTSTNSAAESDQFPFVSRVPGTNALQMTWIRHTGNPGDINSYLDPTTDLMYANSLDGISWSTPIVVMDDASVDTMPSIYPIATGQVLTWMRGVSNEPHVMELEFGGTFPADAVDVTASNGIPGWSPRVTHTLEPGLHLRVWVGGADKRLYYQAFER